MDVWSITQVIVSDFFNQPLDTGCHSAKRAGRLDSLGENTKTNMKPR
jgi:hypothetical protein